MNRKDRKLARKRQLRRRLIIAGIVILVLLFALCCVVRTVWNKKNTETQEKEAENIEVQTDDISGEGIEEAREVAGQAGAPEEILHLLDKNPETVDFVKNYANLKDSAPAETVADEVEIGILPHLLQWDERWGYQSYGESTIAASGCGPTCMSMVVVGLTGDVTVTPVVTARYAEENGYVVEGGGTYAAFMEVAAEEWGITVESSLESETFAMEELTAGHPVICNLDAGKYFTDVGHFIVLTGYEDGIVTVLDPFNIENTEKTWAYEDIKEQIIGMWAYYVEE